MRLMKTFAALSMVLAFGLTACSDDSGETPKSDTGTQKDMAAGDMKAGDMAAQGDGSTPTGACANATDSANIQKQYDGKTLVQIVGAQTACVSQPTDDKKKECIVTNVKAATNNEISEACIGCFAASALCSITQCPTTCITDPTGADCTKCRCGDNTNKVNCVTEFATCAGVPASTQCN